MGEDRETETRDMKTARPGPCESHGQSCRTAQDDDWAPLADGLFTTKACCYGAMGVLLARDPTVQCRKPFNPLPPALKGFDAPRCPHRLPGHNLPARKRPRGPCVLCECSDPRGIGFFVAHQPQSRSARGRCRRHRASRIPVPRQSPIPRPRRPSRVQPDSIA